jgi:hypothetical protein
MKKSVVAACAIILTSCLTTGTVVKTSTYEPTILQEISSWKLDFKYEIATNSNQNGGQFRVDLMFLDELFFAFKDDGLLNVTKSVPNGLLRVDIDRGPNWNGFRYIRGITLEYYDSNGTMLARQVIRHERRSFKDEDMIKKLMNATYELLELR